MIKAKEARAGLSRRSLIGGGAAAALTARSYGRVIGANDRVGLGFIGFGLIGKRHVLDFREQPDARMVAVAEVHRGRRDEALGLMGGSARAHGDFRRCSTTATLTRSWSRRPTTGTP